MKLLRVSRRGGFYLLLLSEPCEPFVALYHYAWKGEGRAPPSEEALSPVYKVCYVYVIDVRGFYEEDYSPVT